MPTDESKRQIVWLYPKHGHSDIESEVRKTGPFRVYANPQKRNTLAMFRVQLLYPLSWALYRPHLH